MAMSISKKGNKGKGNDAVASRLADFTGERDIPIAGHSKMSSSLEQDDVNSGPEFDPSVDDLSNSLECTGFRDAGKVRLSQNFFDMIMECNWMVQGNYKHIMEGVRRICLSNNPLKTWDLV